jgi:23S rRNA pseudouridine955/2504/2580 synthase
MKRPRTPSRQPKHRHPPHPAQRPPPLSAEDDAYIRSFLLAELPDILVFDKPSGLAVQGGSGVTRDFESLLQAFASRKGRKPKLVHRLDRETSGLIVAARTTPAAAMLSAAFAGRLVHKAYVAVAVGEEPPERISLTLRRVRSAQGLDVMRVARPGEPNALEAETEVMTLASAGRKRLLLLKPVTGRMHQLRAHLSAVGCPIAGDEKYGGLLALDGAPVPRLALHAAALSVPDADGWAQVFTAAPPPAFAGMADGLMTAGDMVEAAKRAVSG